MFVYVLPVYFYGICHICVHVVSPFVEVITRCKKVLKITVTRCENILNSFYLFKCVIVNERRNITNIYNSVLHRIK